MKATMAGGALGVLVVAVASGCASAGDDSGTDRPATTITTHRDLSKPIPPLPSTWTYTTPPPPPLTAEEQAYYDAQDQFTKENFSTPQAVVAYGRSKCADLDEHYSVDPSKAVPSMIENKAQLDREALQYLCPKYAALLPQVDAGFYDGTHTVGQDVQPGTYRVRVPEGADGVHDCYWERTSASGDTLANDFVTFAPKGPTVTIRSSDGGFVSKGCGVWIPAQ